MRGGVLLDGTDVDDGRTVVNEPLHLVHRERLERQRLWKDCRAAAVDLAEPTEVRREGPQRAEQRHEVVLARGRQQ